VNIHGFIGCVLQMYKYMNFIHEGLLRKKIQILFFFPDLSNVLFKNVRMVGAFFVTGLAGTEVIKEMAVLAFDRSPC